MSQHKLRNLAIIAHVDHGKTTLVDALFKQSGLFRDNQVIETCAMDSNELERERGITILAKCTSFVWNDYKLNIVDTPGHADFGGEVERILSMVDGVILLVDASEGPMPQTKFVLGKSLSLGLNPIVVINKIDKPDARISEVVDECLDLFIALGANDKQLEFPILYASGRSGFAVKDLNDPRENMTPLLETIVEHIHDPTVDTNPNPQMLITLIESDQYLGRILTGKIMSGTLKVNDSLHALRKDNGVVERARLTKILAFEGLKRIAIEEAQAGDIVSIAGFQEATVADTIASTDITEPLDALPIDPPTISITISVNDSPLAGKDGGKKLTSRMIGDRLMKEAESNVSLAVKRSTTDESYEVSGRGELQLGILIETMRREGFEMSISRPRVLYHNDEAGNRLEPVEEVMIDVDEEFTGIVMEKMVQRKGEMIDMTPSGAGKTRIKFLIPTRGLIGYYGEFLTDTRGTGIMNKSFHSYAPYKGKIEGRAKGVLISTENGKAIPYALFNLKDRGIMFVNAGDPVYAGMIIGEHSKSNDLEVNPTKEKQLSNCRASGKDEHVVCPVPKVMTLEQAIAYIQDDERVEVTPISIRLRKRYLDPNERKRMSRVKED